MNIKMILPTTVLTLMITSCGEPKPVSAEEAAFERASKEITTSVNGVNYGNSEDAKLLAASFSSTIKELQKSFFTGGKENRVLSATNDNFLTFCQLKEDSVVFLVHVPQFKKYKGEVRDSLNKLAWMVANKVTENYKKGSEIELAVALKGSVMYGGSVIGKRGGEPKAENSFSIDTDSFHKYFVK